MTKWCKLHTAREKNRKHITSSLAYSCLLFFFIGFSILCTAPYQLPFISLGSHIAFLHAASGLVWFSSRIIGLSFVCVMNFSWPVLLSPSLSGVLQVSISLKKVELSVGESKFFTCTGQLHTAIHQLINRNMQMLTSRQDLRLLDKVIMRHAF